MKKIAILGYGWLGQHLENYFTHLGYPRPVLINRSVKENCYIYQFGVDALPQKDLEKALLECDTLVVGIPPSSYLETSPDLGERLNLLWPKEKKLIFISSISVLPAKEGTFDEYSEFNTRDERKRKLLEAEISVSK